MSAIIGYPKVSLKEIFKQSGAAGTLPTLDLGFAEFQAKLNAFQSALDSYVLREKEAISQSAAQHSAAVRSLTASKEETEQRIAIEQAKEREMLETIEGERAHVNELQTSVNKLHAQLARIREQSASLDSELAAVRREVGLERATKERQVKILTDMRGKDDQQLAAMEKALGLKIAGVGANRLLFVFTLIDPAKPAREFSFVVDVSEQTYRVPQCDPPIAMTELVQQLNQDRDLDAFIKRVRAAFVAHVGGNGRTLPTASA